MKGLKVAGRSSSFHFKGRNESLRVIGETEDLGGVDEDVSCELGVVHRLDQLERLAHEPLGLLPPALARANLGKRAAPARLRLDVVARARLPPELGEALGLVVLPLCVERLLRQLGGVPE